MVKVRSVEARVFVHATENRDKVLAALRNVVGDARIEEDVLEGYFGNPIDVITAVVEGQQAEEVVLRILSGLSEADRAFLLATLEDRIDKNGSLHIRLDKQKAYLGKFAISDSDDVIKLQIRLKLKGREDLAELERLIKGER